ncbi:hypothetical protein PG996_007881 [Apiospora saccharicola]|uniref:Uncharacterized protein n=1 Tax=Apiospora saccharicola TaxID=335842 RepID=A0ABR1UZH8_9PEZI
MPLQLKIEPKSSVAYIILCRQVLPHTLEPPNIGRISEDSWHLQGLPQPWVRVLHSNRYVFTIPLSDVPGLNRIALGIRDSVTHMLVPIRLASSRGAPFAQFCVHLYHDDIDSGFPHPKVPGLTTKENSRADERYFRSPCTPDPNFFTYLLAKGLKNVLQGQEETLRQTPALQIRGLLIWLAQEASNHVTTRCIISSESCGSNLGFTAARPIACSPKCQGRFEKWPLGVRISPLIRDPSVLDLLLTCLAAHLTAVGLKSSDSLDNRDVTPPWEGCVYDTETMLRIINSFPRLVPSITLQQIIDYGEGGAERRYVLDWLCSRFQGMMVRAPPKDQAMIHMPLEECPADIPRTYLLLNSNASRQPKFEEQLAMHRKDGQQENGIAAFHGTPPQNAFTILCDGLRQNGTTDGDVWVSDNPLYSTTFMWYRNSSEHRRLISHGWSNSMFRDQQILFGVELVKAPYYNNHKATSHQEALMIRHLLIIPAAAADTYLGNSHSEWSEPFSIRPIMESTFQRIHDGSLINDVLGETAREQSHFGDS